jgi:Cof subfamily protein (haloacid dehalogenase superfamily)
VGRGSVVALASGRIASSVARYADTLDVDVALLTLNGAAVYTSARDPGSIVYSVCVPTEFSDHLLAYAAGKDFALNFYHDGTLYGVRSPAAERWIELYTRQTASRYEYVDTFSRLAGKAAHKVLFVGDPARLDKEEEKFRALWGDRVYVVRTWDYYLEFLHPEATKGRGLAVLARALTIDLAEVAAFGDSENDIPMLEIAGVGIAMANALDRVKAAADRVSVWTNDQDGVAREWERLRAL